MTAIQFSPIISLKAFSWNTWKIHILFFGQNREIVDQAFVDGLFNSKEEFLSAIKKVIWEFERRKKLNIDEVDTGTPEGNGVRAELLLHLKERAGLKYREIAEFDIFHDLGLSGLRAIYKNYRK